MQAHIARQAIFDRNLRVVGYELLYRAKEGDRGAVFEDGDRATRSLLSTALIDFGLSNLTDGRRAYINFTEKLVMSDLILLLEPQQIIIELLEDIPVTERLARRLQELRELGYRMALDDYTGDARYDPILPLIDILKVDFLQTDRDMQERIAQRWHHSGVELLAEKVEDRETYEWAARNGYRLFQGYFFARPMNLRKDTPNFNTATYIRLLRELNRPDADLRTCTEIIRTDPALTFRLLKRMRTMQYYHGNSEWILEQAVAYLGIDELHHWTMLLLARNFNVTCSDETVREAYLRGIFMERLLEESPLRAGKTLGFLVGMFSLMDRIMNRPMEELLAEVALPREVTDTLLGQGESRLWEYLAFVTSYERWEPAKLPQLNIGEEALSELYMQCIRDTDYAFRCDQ